MINQNILNNFSSRTAKAGLATNNVVPGQATVQIGSNQSQLYFNENISSKKTRRLRKNFDLLAQAMKNSNTAKKDKKINFQSENNRSYHN